MARSRGKVRERFFEVSMRAVLVSWLLWVSGSAVAALLDQFAWGFWFRAALVATLVAVTLMVLVAALTIPSRNV